MLSSLCVMTRATNMDYENSSYETCSSANPPETIHSGHFMVSEFDDVEAPDDDVGTVPEIVDEQRGVMLPICDNVVGNTAVTSQQQKVDGPPGQGALAHQGLGYDFMAATMITSSTYKFGGPRSSKSDKIDQNLSKLFRCMTLAFSDKLTSPRWRTFKGMKLRWKDKIRLNNVIWRAWHMQFIKRTSPPVCQFASPLDTDAHLKPEAVILEGIYWKRQLSTVLAEYKSWRLFFKKKLSVRLASDKEDNSALGIDFFDWQPGSNLSSHSTGSMMLDEDSPGDGFSDNILKYLVPSYPFAFPNPRDIGRVGIAEFIQPSLVPFQPNLDDYMESMEDIFATKLPTLVEENALSELLDGTSAQSQMSYSNMEIMSPMLSHRLYPQPQPDPPEPAAGVNTFTRDYMSSAAKQGPPVVMDTAEKSGKQAQHLTELSSLLKGEHARYEHYANSGYTAAVNQTGNSARKTSTVSAPSIGFSSTNSATGHSKLLSDILQSTMDMGNSSFAAGSSGCLEELLANDAGAGGLGRRCSMDNKQEDVFAMPKSAHRARSKSGPNLGQTITGPVNMALPITMSSVSVLTPVCPVVTTTTSFVTEPPRTVRATIAPRSATLAEILTKGTGAYRKPSQNNKTSSPVPILPGPHPSQSQAVVISPITLTTVKGVNELQNNILLSTTFGNLMQPAKMLLPSTQSVSQVNQSTIALTDLKSPSPPKPPRVRQTTDKVQQRRECHINAEQKRRCNIKTGFDTLHRLVPTLSNNPTTKVSKATMLDKAGKYIEQLKTERSKLLEEADMLKKQVESLNQAINVCQAQLPAGGVPINCPRPNKLQKLFEDYVRNRTLENWKFWIFSTLIRPLLESYNSTVSTSSIDDMCKTVVTWLEQHCSLRALRPTVYNSLRHLSTTTNILSDPARMKEEAVNAVKRT